MDHYKLSGNFEFNNRDISTTEGFRFVFRIHFGALSKEQHIFVRSKLEEQLGLKPWGVPESWGRAPARYETMTLETKPGDLTRCKTIIMMLKEGGVEMTAMGYNYPANSDHPLLGAINESVPLRKDVGDFAGLQRLIGQTLADAQQAHPFVSAEAAKIAPKNNLRP